MILTFAGQSQQLSHMCTWQSFRCLQQGSNPRPLQCHCSVLKRPWVQIPMKTPANFSGAHMRQSLRLSSKCEDHFLQFIFQSHFTKHFFHYTVTVIIWCCSSFSFFQVYVTISKSLVLSLGIKPVP